MDNPSDRLRKYLDEHRLSIEELAIKSGRSIKNAKKLFNYRLLRKSFIEDVEKAVGLENGYFSSIEISDETVFDYEAFIGRLSTGLAECICKQHPWITICELSNKKESELLKIKNFGSSKLLELKCFLEKHGYTLKVLDLQNKIERCPHCNNVIRSKSKES